VEAPKKLRQASCKEKVQEKVVADKKEVKAVIETKKPVKEPVKREKRSGCLRKKKATQNRGDLCRKITISKLSGTKLTGQTIDLSQFNKPKRKKRT
jgi:translation initiation factor IF-2